MSSSNLESVGFQKLSMGAGLLFSDHPSSAGPVPAPCRTELRAWDEAPLQLPEQGAHFGYVQSGVAQLGTDVGTFPLKQQMFFCLSGSATIRGGSGILITHSQHSTWLQLGGPLEQAGRLRYIDGCTDSLLLPPLMKGDPCLNLLCIPPHTRQTSHTHPSLRAGVIVSGTGQCVTPEGRFPLEPGFRFVIHPRAEHCFHTQAEALHVVAYHPDSDFGPTHEQHPMINRTWIVESAPPSRECQQSARGTQQ